MAKKRKKPEKRTGAYARLMVSMGLMGLMVFLIIFVGTGVFNFAKSAVKESSAPAPSVDNIVVTIPEGSSTQEIADILHENGVISNVLLFKVQSKFGKFDGTYMQGTYAIDPNLDEKEIMALLQTGGNIKSNNKITIPEGYTTAQIATLVEEQGFCSANQFIEEANGGEFDFAFVKEIPGRVNRFEGYLFPDTYFLSDSPTAHEIINKALARFEEFYSDENLNKAKSLGRSFDEIITIASIVESEVRASEERPIAAGVIYNRLEVNMPLQMDSTVQYAQGLKKEVVTYADLEVDSPYNTYKNKGLPLGPISNPGAAAIDAALNPDDNDFIYYVLKDRTSGQHFYTNNYDEFLKAKEQYKAEFQ